MGGFRLRRSLSVLLLGFAGFSTVVANSSPCGLHPVIGKLKAAVGKEFIRKTIRDYLPQAIASKRRFGLEVEYTGLSQAETLEILQRHFGGEITHTPLVFDPSARVVKEPNDVFVLKRLMMGEVPVDMRAYWVESQNYVETEFGNRFEAPTEREVFEILEKIQRGETSLVNPNARLEGSSLGTIEFSTEVNGALELKTEPMTHERLSEIKRMMALLKVNGARGIESGLDVGIHVNVDVDPKSAAGIQRLVTEYEAQREWVHAYFSPHLSRAKSTGPEAKGVFEGFEALRRNEGREVRDIRELRAIYGRADQDEVRKGFDLPVYGDMIGRGKSHALNVRPAIVEPQQGMTNPQSSLLVHRPAAEYRLFNTEFDRIEEKVEFVLAFTEKSMASR